MYIYVKGAVCGLSFNQDTFSLMLRFAGAMLGILLLIWLIALGTPKMAKLVDKLLGKLHIDQGADRVPSPERVGDSDNGVKPQEYKVYDIYEGTPPDDAPENNDKKD